MEICVGIICACLPSCVPLFRALISITGSTVTRYAATIDRFSSGSSKRPLNASYQSKSSEKPRTWPKDLDHKAGRQSDEYGVGDVEVGLQSTARQQEEMQMADGFVRIPIVSYSPAWPQARPGSIDMDAAADDPDKIRWPR